jgi:serine/threonine-protein kinase RsbW
VSGDDYEVSGVAVPAQIEDVHALLARVAAENPDLDPMDVMLFETALVEIANNVVEYGVPSGEVRWNFKVKVDGDSIVCDLVDTGQAFTFDAAAESSMPDPMSDSGRGMAMAQAILDGIQIERLGDTNHWHLVRKLSRPASD